MIYFATWALADSKMQPNEMLLAQKYERLLVIFFIEPIELFIIHPMIIYEDLDD